MDYYREKTSNYNYIKRKYSSSYSKSGKYIGLYNNDEKLGYFYTSCRLATKPIYKYSNYTRYLELIEFGFNNNNIEQIYFLLDYLIEYASQNSCNFIQIKTKKKSFIKFYELLQRYPHTIDNDYIYLDIEPIKYDFLNHITNYDNDKISLKDLYSMGFKIKKDVCYFNLNDNEAQFLDFALRAFKQSNFSSIYFYDEARFKLQTLYSSMGIM